MLTSLHQLVDLDFILYWLAWFELVVSSYYLPLKTNLVYVKQITNYFPSVILRYTVETHYNEIDVVGKITLYLNFIVTVTLFFQPNSAKIWQSSIHIYAHGIDHVQIP